MPISCNSLLKTKTVRIENSDGSKGVYLYYDSFDEKFKTSMVNPDPDVVPDFEAFTFNQSTLNQSEYFTVNESMLVHVYFDANIGANTTISSLNGFVSKGPNIDNWFNFSYNCSTITDVISIIVWNQNNTKYKAINLPITLRTTQGVPLSFSQNPTTQNFAYSNLVVNFNKAIKSIGSITSSQNPQNITFTTNNSTSVTLTNYTTPTTDNDVLTFSSVVDTSDIANTAAVTLNISNLSLGPKFFGLENMINTASQNHTYTDIIAKFNKTIIQNPDVSKPISVVADIGPNPTNIRIENGVVKFDWSTGSNTTVKLSFLNLYSSDGLYDDGLVESTTFTLNEPVTSVYWFANQPISLNTQYTDVEVTFNKRISSCVAGGSGFVSLTPKGVNSRGNFVFDVLTGSTQSTFDFHDIIGEDYSFQSGPLSLSVGAIIESVVNETGNVSNQVLIKAESQTISFTFNKAISNEPTLGINGGASYQFSSKSNSDKTLHYNFTNVSSGSNLIIFGAVISPDGSYSSELNVVLSPVPALTFNLISDVTQPDISKTSYDVGTLYNLYAKFNTPPDLNANFSGVSVSCPNATVGAITSVDNGNKYKFTLTPDNASTNQISITNAKDVNNFIYSLFKSGNLTFNTVLTYLIDFKSDQALFNPDGSVISWNSTGTQNELFQNMVSCGAKKGLVFNGKSAIQCDITGSAYFNVTLPKDHTFIYTLCRKNLINTGWDPIFFSYDQLLNPTGGADTLDAFRFYNYIGGSTFFSQGIPDISAPIETESWHTIIVTRGPEKVDVYYDGVLFASGSRNLTNRNSTQYGTINHSIMPMHPSRGGRFIGVNILQMSVIGTYIDQSNVSDIHNNQITYYGPQ